MLPKHNLPTDPFSFIQGYVTNNIFCRFFGPFYCFLGLWLQKLSKKSFTIDFIARRTMPKGLFSCTRWDHMTSGKNWSKKGFEWITINRLALAYGTSSSISHPQGTFLIEKQPMGKIFLSLLGSLLLSNFCPVTWKNLIKKGFAIDLVRGKLCTIELNSLKFLSLSRVRSGHMILKTDF